MLASKAIFPERRAEALKQRYELVLQKIQEVYLASCALERSALLTRQRAKQI